VPMVNVRSHWGILAAFAATLAACSPLGPHALPPSEYPALGAPSQPVVALAATKHLYVLEFDASKAVLEYPIRNGIPAASPDRTITGLAGPNAINFDDSGNLYVLDGRIVKEFAPGANGNAHPIRSFHVPLSLNIGSLAIDANGYAYVGQKASVHVYAPGARGYPKAVAKFKPVGYPAGLAVDASNDLYALGNTQSGHPVLHFQAHVSVYANPTNPQRVREFCTRELPNHGIDYGIALDGAGNLFTTHPYFINSSPHGEIDVYDANADTCPVNPIARITTTGRSLLGPVYLALDGAYLYVYDLDYGNGGVVFTLHASGNPQKPLSTLFVKNGQGHNVQGIAIGP
jgi:hypothetical protein